jgi:hypothetical protein
MRRPSPNSCILGIFCILLGLAAAGPARAQASGRAGQVTGFPSANARTAPSFEGDNLGVGIFSNIPFRVTVTVRGGYDDNITTSSGSGQGSGFINGSIGLTYDFGSPRTRFSLQMGGGVTDYFDRPNQSDPDYNAYLGLSLKHLFSPRLILNVSAYAAYQVEPDFSFGTGFNRRSGNYFYTSDKFTLSYLWTPRFSTATSYTFGALLYDNTASSGVGSFENRIENTFGNEFRFLLWPTTTLVAEYRIQFIAYQTNNSDATSQFILAGFDHSFSPQFSGSFRGGFQIRSLDSTQVVQPIFPFLPPQTVHTSGESTSPYLEGTLNYAVGKKTSITWTNRYGIEEPDIPGQPGRVTYRTGLQGKYDWTPRISSRLAIFYAHDDYSATTLSPAFVEDSIDVALSLRYAITRYLGVEVGYNHTEILSDVSLREYSRNRFYAGADFTF